MAAAAKTTSQSANKRRPPTEKPTDFDFKTLRQCIPKHCFERSLVRSFSYLLGNLLVCALLWYASTWIDHPAVPKWLAYGLLWPLYWFWQGAFGTGLWVIAHECGHGAFSDYTWVNDSVGFAVHSALLVPYYSWKHSHARHHKNTGSVDYDEVFVPPVKPPGTPIPAYFTHPLYRLSHIAMMLTVGWPLYLLTNVSGRPGLSGWVSHFHPTSPIFINDRERLEVALSDLGLVAAVGALAFLAHTLGTAWLVKTYVVPYLIVNFWLVLITYLQHTHPDLPHYGEGEWDWLRGALATVDRSYGILDHIFHHISDTHVVHHLFSYMPHYHAVEATRAVKKVLGSYYMQDDRNVFKALWEDFSRCCHVSPDKAGDKVYWYTH